MKKFTLILSFLMLITFSNVMSQDLPSFTIGGKALVERIHNGFKSPTDTVFLDEFFTSSTNFYNYLAPGYGYIFGPHWDTAGQPRSLETAQGYLFLGSPYGVEGALIWVARKSQTSVNGSKLFVKLYNLNGTSSYTIGGTPYTIDCPGTTPVGRDTIEWTDIDTSSTGWTVATFNPPITVSDNYVIGLDVSNFYMNGDTISVIGGEGAASANYGLEYTFYKYPNPALWVQFSHIWSSGGNPIDAAIAIFPIIDENYAGVENGEFINGIKMSQNYPNPSNGITSVVYALEESAEVSIDLFDQSGKKITTIYEGCKQPGVYTANFTEELSAGIYYYSLSAGKNRLTKKMCIE